MIHSSSQDVPQMAYAREMLDIVTGNQVLHHFAILGGTLGDVRGLLRSRGFAIFSGPFVHGYPLAMLVMKACAMDAYDGGSKA